MRKKLVLSVMVFVLLLSSMAHAVRYIDAPPLSEVVKASVGNCSSGVSQLPIITWGGDIGTVVANGNQKNTAAGSIFSQQGLNFTLVREDVFPKQVEAYLECDSPYLRGTMGMINMAADVTEKDSRTKMEVVYQHTWSTGGDAMVVKNNIKTARDLKGKTIVLQAYGPHVDYLTKILSDAGLSMRDVKIKWVKDLTGTDNTPGAALHESDIDAVMVIIPDALALTSGGTVGTGAEDSVKGAKILVTTKAASRIIADVYAVRADYFADHREEVKKFVHGLMLAEEATKDLFKNKKSQGAKYNQTISAAAAILLDSPQAISDTEGLYGDCEYVGWKGNVEFFANKNYPRNFERLTGEIQKSFLALGLIDKKVTLNQAKWDYDQLKDGLKNTSGVAVPKFDTEKVTRVVEKKQKQGKFEDEEFLPSFEILFKPNQEDFPVSQYEEDFRQVVDRASTYYGAVITIEGNVDPQGYLKKKKANASQIDLNQIKQVLKNLSLARANSVRDAVIRYAKSEGITLDPTQFVIVGHGIANPVGGMCGSDPCAPKNEEEWKRGRRVEFRLMKIEAEETQFEKLD